MEATDQEIGAYRKKVNDLTEQCLENPNEARLQNELQSIAYKVGASTCVFWVHTTSSTIKSTPADTSELIRNIHQALQTASMVNMCKRAREGYEMATKASNRAWIFAAIAFLSMIAAWITAFLN